MDFIVSANIGQRTVLQRETGSPNNHLPIIVQRPAKLLEHPGELVSITNSL